MSVPHAVLALVARGLGAPSALRKELDSRMGEVWPVNRGQIATTLDRLERDGLVRRTVADEGPPTFSITSSGRSALDTWWSDPVARDSPRRDELALKLALAVDEPDVDLVGIVRTQRTESLRALQDLQRLAMHVGPDPRGKDLAWSLVLDGLIVDVEAELRWLDAVEGRLRASRARATERPPERAAASTPESLVDGAR